MKRKFRENNGGGSAGSSMPALTWLSVKSAFAKTFLPLGYPDSVKAEYAEFQVWDSLQALSSYLRGVLSSRFVFEGLGVGDGAKSGLSAALAWVYKDGIGIVSSLLFAYRFTPYFDAYPSSFRLVADSLCNVGLLLNMSLGLLPSKYFIFITSLASICFGCLGIAAGATKSKISAHLAKGGHLGDLIAKESTQESAITLIGMLLGIAVTSAIGDSVSLSWIVFTLCTIFHQYANYRLVKVLKFTTINNQRLWLLVNEMVSTGTDINTNDAPAIPSPAYIARLESLFTLPLYLALHGPLLGASMRTAKHVSLSSEPGGGLWGWDNEYIDIFETEGGSCPYIVSVDNKEGGREGVLICLSDACTHAEMVEACVVGYLMHLHIHPQDMHHYDSSNRKERRLGMIETSIGTSSTSSSSSSSVSVAVVARLLAQGRRIVTMLRAGAGTGKRAPWGLGGGGKAGEGGEGEGGKWDVDNVCLVGDRGFRYHAFSSAARLKED